MFSFASFSLLFAFALSTSSVAAQDLAVVDQRASDVVLFDRDTGALIGSYGDPEDGPGPVTNSLETMVFQPATGDLFLSNGFGGIQVYGFDTGALVGAFGETASGLSRPLGMAFHPTTGNLFVVDNFNQDDDGFKNGDVREFDGTTGAFLGSFGQTQENLSAPLDLVFHPQTGELLVSGNRPVDGGIGVYRFDSTTGNFLGALPDTVAFSVSGTLAVQPGTGDVFVGFGAGTDVRRFTSAGILVGDPDNPSFGKTKENLQQPLGMVFHPDTGNLLVADGLSDDIRAFDGTTGAFIGIFGDSLLLESPSDLAFEITGTGTRPTPTSTASPNTPGVTPTTTPTAPATTPSPTPPAGNDLDFGDAPDSGSDDETYPTRLADDGARHVIVGGFFLGDNIDAEGDGQPDASATGDDLNGAPDDEDGVSFADDLRAGAQVSVSVVASQQGKLDAWMDFNRDGDWEDGGEQIVIDEELQMGANDLVVTVPADASTGPTFARFRYSSAGGLSYTGAATDGEVEDYEVEVLPSGDSCPGDCNGDGQVSVDEIIVGVNIALGARPVDDCRAMDTSGDEQITVDELIAAVNAALGGCDRPAVLASSQS